MLRHLTLVFLIVPLAAPAHAGGLSPNVFAEAYHEIVENYLDPVPLVDLVTEGAQHLGGPDSQERARVTGGALIVSDGGADYLRLAVPGPSDAEGWARTTVALIAAMRAHDPTIAGISTDEAYRRFFEGAFTRLDRFTRYAGPEQAREQRAQRDGFGGIGVTLDTVVMPPKIAAVAEGSPAARAGIHADDRLVAIDGVDLARLDAAEIVRLLRGPVGSDLTVTVSRGDRKAERRIPLARALITPASAKVEVADGIVSIRLRSFSFRAADEIARALKRAAARPGPPLDGAILDLRGNPGGLLDQARDVASLFLDQGLIATTKGRNPNAAQRLVALGGDRLHGLPLIVLVNGGTASSAEIVAAALQDDRRAVLVGSASFGKGTVQMVLPLENDGEMTLTWARISTPGGYLLNQHGVVPLFCTSTPEHEATKPEDGSIAVERIVDHGGEQALRPRPPASLDETGWTELRNRCPPVSSESDLDLAVAHRLLRDPDLYARALGPGSIARAGAESRGAAGSAEP